MDKDVQVALRRALSEWIFANTEDLEGIHVYIAKHLPKGHPILNPEYHATTAHRCLLNPLVDDDQLHLDMDARLCELLEAIQKLLTL